MRRRTYLGTIVSTLAASAGCVRGGGSGPVVDETVESERMLGFSAVADESIEVVVQTLAGERTVVDLVDPEGEILIDGVEVADERTFTVEARNTGSHELFVTPDGRASVTVRIE